MNILLLMLCAMLAGAAPLALLFVPLLLPARSVPAPEPEYAPDPEYAANWEAHRQHMADCAEFGWQW
jgi:hypothetical protein